MLLTETSLICAAALGAGIAITAFLLATLAPLIETQLGRPAPSASGITIDTTVLLIVGGISLLVAVALSLAPLTSWGRGLTNALQQDGRVASEGRTMRRLRSGLIAFEIAGSLVLLVGCGLMIRSVVNMMSTDFGFDADGLVQVADHAPGTKLSGRRGVPPVPRTIRRPRVGRDRVNGCLQQLAAVRSAADASYPD